ncbi:unnamed protein product [Amoebophrya sp. A120]|nr:unnamed protein product [Amoebophrya sp. A120]|eukprot:GSA120T00005818001.1
MKRHALKFGEDAPTFQEFRQKHDNIPLRLLFKTFCVYRQLDHLGQWENLEVVVLDLLPLNAAAAGGSKKTLLQKTKDQDNTALLLSSRAVVRETEEEVVIRGRNKVTNEVETFVPVDAFEDSVCLQSNGERTRHAGKDTRLKLAVVDTDGLVVIIDVGRSRSAQEVAEEHLQADQEKNLLQVV